MSFTLRLSQDLTAVEAGATVPLSIEVTNKGEEADRFEMQVEGLDPEWTALPEAEFVIGSKEIHSQKVFFKPPRASESLAGNYPFVIRVRSLNSGEARTAQGVLQIKAFNHLSMEISPKKGYTSPLRQQNQFSLTVMNLGNTEHTLQLTGADPEEECTYDFENDQVTVGPGQQKPVEVTVRSGNAGWIAPVRLFGFSISGRSMQNPSVMANAQGQLERRPLLSIASIVSVIVVLAVAILWYAFRPLPPTIRASSNSPFVLRGQSVEFHWKAAHASSVRLEISRSVGGKVQNPETVEDLPIESSRELMANDEDTITVTAYAVGENKTVEAAPVTIVVQEVPKAKPPTIESFSASTRKVKLGEPVIFKFDYSQDTTKLVLSPLSDRTILPPAKQMQVTPNQIGTVEYQLIAYNDKGAYSRSKAITVEAYQVSEAVILDFSAQPAMIVAPDTQTILSWNVTNAVQVQLKDPSGVRKVAASDSAPLTTDKDVTVKLIATDSHGITTSKELNIHFKPLPPPDTTGGGPPTTGTGTGTGGPH